MNKAKKILTVATLFACLAGSAVVIGAGATGLIGRNGSEVSTPRGGTTPITFVKTTQANGTLILTIEPAVTQGSSDIPIQVPADTSMDVDQIIISNGTWSNQNVSAGGITIGQLLIAVPATYGIQTVNLARPLRLEAGEVVRITPSLAGTTSAFWDITLIGRSAPALTGLTIN